MDNDLDTRLSERLSKLEGRHRRLRMLLLVNAALLLAVAASLAASCAASQARQSMPGTLRVSQLEVVDSQGVVRVRIGSNLPDAIVQGKRVPRGSKVSGVMLYDETGQERGGYVTFTPGGNIGLTLDTRRGQAALFAADPEAGAVLKLWHDGELVELRADPDGARATATHEKRVVFQEPPIQDPEKSEICIELKGARSRLSETEVMGYCLEAMPEDACRKCLGGNG
jgi:hypothetical protein